MTRPLVAIERFFERLFERPATRLFHPRLQPVQLQRKLERAMESERRISADRTYVRDRYRILLNPTDFEDFAGLRGELETDFAEALLIRARQRGYTLLARPRVRLEASTGVEPGEVEVVADLLDPNVLREVAAGLKRVDGSGRHHHEVAAPVAVGVAAGVAGGPVVGSVPQREAAHIPTQTTPAATQTAPYQAPKVNAPAAIIEIAGPGMPPHRVAYRGGTLRVGRAPDCEIILADDRVSRKHGSITSRQGALIFADLGSTNGSFVNGSRVTEIALGTGDVVRLGNTTLTIRPDL